MGKFLSICKAFYIVKWDLNDFKTYIDKKVDLEYVRNKCNYIWNQKVYIADEAEILEVIKSLEKGG